MRERLRPYQPLPRAAGRGVSPSGTQRKSEPRSSTQLYSRATPTIDAPHPMANTPATRLTQSPVLAEKPRPWEEQRVSTNSPLGWLAAIA